jgi:hypothetical protein
MDNSPLLAISDLHASYGGTECCGASTLRWMRANVAVLVPEPKIDNRVISGVLRARKAHPFRRASIRKNRQDRLRVHSCAGRASFQSER